MKTLTHAAALAALVFVAGAADAQVVGGLTGQAGAAVQVSVPHPGPIVAGVGSTVRDTSRDVRDLALEARPDVNANANARADVRSDRDGAAVDAAIQTGAAVRSSDGATLGSVVDVTRNAVGRATSFVVRTTDGATRTIPAGSVSADAGALVTVWTEEQFKRPR